MEGAKNCPQNATLYVRANGPVLGTQGCIWEDPNESSYTSHVDYGFIKD